MTFEQLFNNLNTFYRFRVAHRFIGQTSGLKGETYMALEKLDIFFCPVCRKSQSFYGYTSQRFGENADTIIVTIDWHCTVCSRFLKTEVEIEPFIQESIPISPGRDGAKDALNYEKTKQKL